MATVVLVNLAFLAFLVMKPVPQKTIAMLDNVGLTGAILLAGLIPLVMTLIAGAKRSLAPGYFRPALFLSLGILAFGIGEVIWSYYEVILHRETPFPSWADAGYLFTYPFLGIGILSLPARPLTALRRIRVIFDGLIVVAALFTFSWSFVLGPTVLKASETLVAKVLGAAYPGGDLLLLFLLFVLSCRSLDRSLRATIAALTCGLISFIVADSAFCYLTLQEKYQTGSVFDTGWSLGFMVAAYGVVTLLDAGRAARVAPDTSDKSDKSDRSEETPDQSAHIQHDSLFRLLLPYVAVVFSWVLTYHVQRTREIEAVEPGVYWGAGAVAVLVVARQILALVENSRLNRRLLEAQVLIDAESRRVEAANRALDATNRMLEEQKEELIAQTEELESQQVVLEEQQEQLIVQQADLFAANEKLHEVNEQMSVALRELAEAKSQLEEANERLSRQATTDGLTGLSNHRTFQEKLAEQDQRARRYASPLSLLLLDVDKFKQYNDTYGHPAGDIVLKRVAAILKSECRATDVPARYGGEEFVLILPETDKEAALNAAERIREAIEAFSWPERSVTVSIGASTLTAQMNSQAELIAEADRALYDSKRKGRNRVTHSADALADDGFACGTSFPYTQMLQEMLAAQEEELSTAAERVKSVLVEGYDRTIESMARLLDMKDKETEGHSQRVMDLTVQLARFVGMNEEEVLYLKWGALLHDIGKMAVPDAILHKPGKLDEEEWKVMRQHPVVAYEMLSPIKFLQPALEIPYGHHEKWDGTGYPLGLAGDAIPLGARLFAVIDVWDALTSDRPYRPAWTEDKALKYLEENAGTHFDPRAVRAFLAMLEDRRTQEHDMERVVRKAA